MIAVVKFYRLEKMQWRRVMLVSKPTFTTTSSEFVRPANSLAIDNAVELVGTFTKNVLAGRSFFSDGSTAPRLR